MKLSEKICLIFTVVIVALGVSTALKADTGWDQAARIERGSYIAIRSISISSNTGTELFSDSVKRPDGLCFNNTAATIWIGTTSATLENVEHSNITNGFPLLSSSTFKLDGSMSGTVYATGGIGQSAQNVRCIDGLVQ